MNEQKPGNPTKKRYIVDVNVDEVEKRRHPEKHYVYIIQVTWSDGDCNIIYRRYRTFFSLQVTLLKTFPQEAGRCNPQQRIIPFLPGKIIFGRSHINKIALKRLEPVNSYCKQLISLPAHISQCKHVLDFFKPTLDDLLPKVDRETNEFKAMEISTPVLLDEFLVKKDYKKQDANEIDLKAGEVVGILDSSETGWWLVSGEGGLGWIPSIYLEPLDNTVMECDQDTECPYLAIRDYIPKQSDELQLEMGSLVTVLKKSFDGWWLVRRKDKEGLVPAVCLSPANTLKSRRLLFLNDSQKPSEVDNTECETDGSIVLMSSTKAFFKSTPTNLGYSRKWLHKPVAHNGKPSCPPKAAPLHVEQQPKFVNRESDELWSDLLRVDQPQFTQDVLKQPCEARCRSDDALQQKAISANVCNETKKQHSITLRVAAIENYLSCVNELNNRGTQNEPKLRPRTVSSKSDHKVCDDGQFHTEVVPSQACVSSLKDFFERKQTS